MKHVWPALSIVLALTVLTLDNVGGQGSGQPPPTTQRMAGSLGRNFPNPFNPTTTIPFTIGMEGNPPVCKDPSRRHRVTLKVYNTLVQLVAVPILQGGGESVNGLLLGCGDYKAFWDGTLASNGLKASSGTYLYILDVDGQLAVKKMLVTK